MLARAPATYPRVVMDLERLALKDATFDAAVATFVLFHLPDPLRGVRQIAASLRAGGVFGTITWDGEPDFAAQLAWQEQLDVLGAARVGTVLNHEPVSTPAKVDSLLRAAGFVSVRTWTEPFEYRYTPESFLEMRTRLGGSRLRYESLAPDRRRLLLNRMRERLAAMRTEALVDSAEMIFAIGFR